LVFATHSLRRVGGIVVGLGLLLAAFQFLLTQIATYLVRHSAFAQLSMLMPDFVRTVAGPSALAFMSFTGVVGLGYFHPVVIAATIGVTIVIATEPASEVETRFVDLTLARELTRADVISRSVLVFAASAVFVLGMMVAGTSVGLSCCTPVDIPRPSPSVIVSLAISLGTVMVCWAGIAAAAAALARRRAVAGAIVGVAALAAYLLDYVGRAWDPARALSRLSPFHYFEPTTLITGQPLRAGDVLPLLATGIVGIAAAYILFARRDI
jgi:ABC-type transport system involved in multi-copper enzyme maturation permease subunit